MEHHRKWIRGARRSMRAAPLLCALIAALGTPACFFYPDSSERVDDDLVITARKPKADFGAYKTFAVSPTVKVLEVEADGDVETKDADPDIAEPVLERLVKNMKSRGYEQTDDKTTADLGLSVTAIQGLVIGASYGYWGGYYGYYWGYPGWGYYYPYPTYYAYEPGTLIIDMADLDAAREMYPDGLPEKPADPSEGNPGPGGVPVVWTMAGYRAYVDDSDTVKVTQANAAIDQAFDQSPYLKTK